MDCAEERALKDGALNVRNFPNPQSDEDSISGQNNSIEVVYQGPLQQRYSKIEDLASGRRIQSHIRL